MEPPYGHMIFGLSLKLWATPIPQMARGGIYPAEVPHQARAHGFGLVVAPRFSRDLERTKSEILRGLSRGNVMIISSNYDLFWIISLWIIPSFPTKHQWVFGYVWKQCTLPKWQCNRNHDQPDYTRCSTNLYIDEHPQNGETYYTTYLPYYHGNGNIPSQVGMYRTRSLQVGP